MPLYFETHHRRLGDGGFFIIFCTVQYPLHYSPKCEKMYETLETFAKLGQRSWLWSMAMNSVVDCIKSRKTQKLRAA